MVHDLLKYFASKLPETEAVQLAQKYDSKPVVVGGAKIMSRSEYIRKLM